MFDMRVNSEREGGTSPLALTVDTGASPYSSRAPLTHPDKGSPSPLASNRSAPLTLTPSSSSLAFRPLTAGEGVLSLIEGTTDPAPASPPVVRKSAFQELMDQMRASLLDMQNTIKKEGEKEALVPYSLAPGSHIDLAALSSQLQRSVLAKQQSFSIKKASSPSARVGQGLPGFGPDGNIDEDDDLSLDGPGGGKQLVARQVSQSRGFNPNKPTTPQGGFKGTGGKLGALMQFSAAGSPAGSKPGSPHPSLPSSPLQGGRKSLSGGAEGASDSGNDLIGTSFNKPKRSALEILEAETKGTQTRQYQLDT